jgi:hypothetical protein
MCGSSPFKGTGPSERSLALAQMTAMSSHDAWMARLEKPFSTWGCERQRVWLMLQSHSAWLVQEPFVQC